MSFNLKSKAFLFGSLVRHIRQNTTKTLFSSYHVYSKSVKASKAILLLKTHQVLLKLV